ncbi:MAG: hypothetical protein M5U08_05605 [Burkholderiales bacterium]|nr:hypothetical protein [Burkholderiales bacterium]
MIGCVTISGLGITITQVVIALAQNSLVLALVLTAIAGIVLGMGMPRTPTDIDMVALLVAAALRLIKPRLATDLAGPGVLALIAGRESRVRKRSRTRSA